MRKRLWFCLLAPFVFLFFFYGTTVIMSLLIPVCPVGEILCQEEE